jgi:arylsulfatase A-like enzyme
LRDILLLVQHTFGNDLPARSETLQGITVTDRNRQARATNWIVASVWFALAAASIHLLYVLYVRYVEHELTWTGREFLWMAPLSYLLVYAMVGSLGGIVAFYRPALGRPRVVVTVLAAVAIFGALLLLVPRVHPLASAVLAAGVAVQGARRTQPGSLHIPVIMRFAALPAIVIGLFGGVEQVSRQWREDRTMAAQSPPSDAPNVILIVMDAVRADNTSAYGYPEPTTPTLERLAREGVLFERAFATAPWSLPSHAGIFTGLLPSELYADWKTPFRRNVPTLAEQLRDHGWATGMFSANVGYVTWETGLARGFVHVDDYSLVVPEVVRCNVLRQALDAEATAHRGTPWMFNEHYRRDARQTVDRFLRWQGHIGGRPFFAFVNLLDAHEQPMVADTEIAKFRSSSKSPDASEYDAAIAQMDGEIGRLVDSLARRGISDRTLLIVTSDHGQLLGEHGLMYHASSLYRRVLQVPLVLRFPGRIPVGKRLDRVASLRDLAPTIVDLISAGTKSSLHGSLARFWESADTVARGDDLAVAQVSRLARGILGGPANDGPLDALISDRWYYIEGPGNRRELFAYTTDTSEATNLANDAAYRDTVALLSRKLRSIAPRSAPLEGKVADPP